MNIQRTSNATLFYLLLFVLLCAPLNASAISVSKSTYLRSEFVTVSCTLGNNFTLHSLPSGEFLNVFECGNSTNSVYSDDVGDFAVLEYVVEGGGSCVGLTRDECKVAPEFVGESIFRVVVSAGGGEASGAFSAHRPEVSIQKPGQNSIFAHEGNVEYIATDKNDRGGDEERTRLGFIPNPVSIFYSDTISEWDHAIVDPEDKILLLKNQPAVGTTTFSTEVLVPGVLYRIVVDAIDAIGEIGEDVSDFFTVDFEKPRFTITADPPVSRNENVTLRIESSKDLAHVPEVFVTQKGGESIPVAISGEGRHFEGLYEVRVGYDGIARISVTGTDRAGNTGIEIVGGGTFAVGVNPPPKPTISNLLDGTIVTEGTVSVSGAVREDTSVRLIVNAVDTYETLPAADGSFSFQNIALIKERNRGVNVLSVYAIDKAGLTSEVETVTIKYNVLPELTLTSPNEGEIVGGKIGIDALARDENSDILSYTFQLISSGVSRDALSATSSANTWVTIAENIPSRRFSWESTEVDDGDYFVRVIADDGTAKVYSSPVRIIVRNTLPFFRFEDGRKTVVGTTTAEIRGRALTPEKISPRPSVVLVEYSLDNGKVWTEIPAEQASDVRFSLTLTDLTEGVQGMLFRVKDSRGLYGRASHPVIVDAEQPSAPVIILPEEETLITDADDANLSLHGVQISVTGAAEQFSTIMLTVGGVQYAGRAAADGNFSIHGVTIANRGRHDIEAIAIDQAGNKSPNAVTSFIYDNPPRIVFLNPKPSRALFGKAEVRWTVSDADGDTARSVILSYRRGSEAFKTLSVQGGGDSFIWDVTSLPQGKSYELRLEIGDGLATSTEIVAFSIDSTPPPAPSLLIGKKILGQDDFFTAHGTAEDDSSGIEYVEYAITEESVQAGQENWVRSLIPEGFLKQDATFSILHPTKLTDGSYRVSVRAVDAAGNESPIFSEYILVDGSPPRVGSFAARVHGVLISPDEHGSLFVYDGLVTFVVSLEADVESASIEVGHRSYPLVMNVESGLWESTVDLSRSGINTILLSAEDAVGNSVKAKNLGSFMLVPRGSVSFLETDNTESFLSRGVIRVLRLQDETGRYVPFSSVGTASGEVAVNSDGTYELTLPKGTYKLFFKHDGYQAIQKELSLSRSSLINVSFATRELSGISGFIQEVIDYIRYEL